MKFCLISFLYRPMQGCSINIYVLQNNLFLLKLLICDVFFFLMKHYKKYRLQKIGYVAKQIKMNAVAFAKPLGQFQLHQL